MDKTNELIQNYYIKKINDSAYVIASDTHNASNGYCVTKDGDNGIYSFNMVKSLYESNPQCRFEEFDDIKQLKVNSALVTQYKKTYNTLQSKLNNLIEWFTMYDQQVQQYNRAIRLNLPYDAKYGTIDELDAQATINSQQISELRKQIAELEKTKPIEPIIK